MSTEDKWIDKVKVAWRKSHFGKRLSDAFRGDYQLHRVRVPEEFAPFIGEAVMRLRYLHPEVSVEQNANEVVWSAGPNAATTDVEREITYLLYRAKIYAEGRAQRAALSRMAFGK